MEENEQLEPQVETPEPVQEPVAEVAPPQFNEPLNLDALADKVAQRVAPAPQQQPMQDPKRAVLNRVKELRDEFRNEEADELLLEFSSWQAQQATAPIIQQQVIQSIPEAGRAYAQQVIQELGITPQQLTNPTVRELVNNAAAHKASLANPARTQLQSMQKQAASVETSVGSPSGSFDSQERREIDGLNGVAKALGIKNFDVSKLAGGL